MTRLTLFILTTTFFQFNIGFGQTFNFNDTTFKVGSQKIIYGDIYCTDRFDHLCNYQETNKLFYDSIGQFLKRNKTVHIILRHYTSINWDSLYCLELTIRKSIRLKDALVRDFALDTNQIKAEGYGQNEPIISKREIDKMSLVTDKEKAHDINRRTLIIITKK